MVHPEPSRRTVRADVGTAERHHVRASSGRVLAWIGLTVGALVIVGFVLRAMSTGIVAAGS